MIDNTVEETKLAELDVTNEQFDPLLALYHPNYRISKKDPKQQYQNFSAFESAVNRLGVWNLNKRKTSILSGTDQLPGTSSTQADKSENNINARRFLPHQMPVRRILKGNRNKRNILTLMTTITGPLSLMQSYVVQKQRIRVVIRKEHGIRGMVYGILLYFDKYWNLLLKDVTEIYCKRKMNFVENKVYGIPKDCNDRLKDLGIELPRTMATSLNRKNVQLERSIPKLLIRGEQIVLINALKN